MINKTILVGRLTKDPELKYTSSNIAFARFTLAVNRTFGEKETDFIQCIVWRKQAENLGKYVRKGNLVGVEGRIQTGSYDDKDGKRVYTTDVVCDNVQYLETKEERDKLNNSRPQVNNTDMYPEKSQKQQDYDANNYDYEPPF